MHKPRIGLILTLIALMLGVIEMRLFYLQGICGWHYRRVSEERIRRRLTTDAPRGAILDRDGRELARDDYAFDISFFPHKAIRTPEVLARLAHVIGWNAEDRERVEAAVEREAADEDRESLIVASNVGFNVMAEVETHAELYPGVVVKERSVRRYPFGALAAHAIGYMAKIPASREKEYLEQGYFRGDMIGGTGIERACEERLRGRRGGKVLVIDMMDGLRKVDREVAPVAGEPLRLTLDADLQRAAEGSFPEGRGGAVVALDVRTGEILVLASRPAFNLNDLVPPVKRGVADFLNRDPSAPALNRAMGDGYPAGSIFKIVVAFAGLEGNRLGEGTTHTCAGSFRHGNREFKCNNVHGTVDLVDAIKVSCNVYFYQAGLAAGKDDLLTWAERFGFGRKTGVDLPWEKPGFLPTPAWKKAARKEGWFEGDTINISIGQGNLLVTPLQVARMMAAVANGGTLITPFLANEHRPAPATLPKLSFNIRSLEVVRKGLWKVVHETGGTGSVLRIDGFDVAGKTGTAQAGGNRPDHAWFAGYGPYESPEICVVAVVEHSGHGGVIAGPVAKAVFETYYKKYHENTKEEENTKKKDDAVGVAASARRTGA
ncbi:MAG: penicillin-binding protein 2 [Planctomycetota bacterium]